MRVGFGGRRSMNQGMARRLLDAGHDLSVYDVFPAQAAPLAAAGAQVAASVAELAARSEIVVTMLVEDAAISQVGLGPRGIVVGGPEDAVARCTVLLQSMGRRIFSAGVKPESATAIKLANNAVLGCAMVAMAEGFALVRKYDVAPQVFQDVMVEWLFGATAYKVYGQKMVDESFDQVGSPMHVGLKDASLIAAAADLARVPMPSHYVYRDRLLGAVALGVEN